MPEISHRLQQVLTEISLYEQEFGRAKGSVQLVAVSKTRTAADLRKAWESGQRHFAESYLQEALEKIAELHSLPIHWHFIGPIQSNKTRTIAEHFAWVHSIERLKIAQRLSAQRPKDMPPLQVLLQVNSSDEGGKSGCSFDELESLAAAVSVLPGLQLRGLMTIPARSNDFEQQRRPFNRLRQALQQLKRKGFELDTLSMGMSNDIRAAIAEGATMVRVGTAIFGSRERASRE